MTVPYLLHDPSGVYICKSIVNHLRHGNYIFKSEGIHIPTPLLSPFASKRNKWNRPRAIRSQLLSCWLRPSTTSPLRKTWADSIGSMNTSPLRLCLKIQWRGKMSGPEGRGLGYPVDMLIYSGAGRCLTCEEDICPCQDINFIINHIKNTKSDEELICNVRRESNHLRGPLSCPP